MHFLPHPPTKITLVTSSRLSRSWKWARDLLSILKVGCGAWTQILMPPNRRRFASCFLYLSSPLSHLENPLPFGSIFQVCAEPNRSFCHLEIANTTREKHGYPFSPFLPNWWSNCRGNRARYMERLWNKKGAHKHEGKELGEREEGRPPDRKKGRKKAHVYTISGEDHRICLILTDKTFGN